MNAQQNANIAHADSSPVLPGATLGVLGGGQLGRMWAQAAAQLGYRTVVLEPDPHSPAGQVSANLIQADYADLQGLAQLATKCQAVTTEFENVPAPTLQWLADQGCTVAPSAQAVAIAQDRLLEKALFTACGGLDEGSLLRCAPYLPITTAADCAAVPAQLLPGILKTARLGYDGKGQQSIATAAELLAAWQRLGGVPCVLEKRLALKAECSVVAARGRDGSFVSYAAQVNTHIDGVLALTEAYGEASNLPLAQCLYAREAIKTIAEKLGYVGVLCLEFLIVDDGSADGAWVVNEMAPRPHNSGHYTMDACDVSQFELQVRAMAGLPLPQPRQHSPALMLNLLGDLWFQGDGSRQPRTPDWTSVLALPGAHLHLYGKAEARRGRKMGHLTITGAEAAQVQAVAHQAIALLGLPPLRLQPLAQSPPVQNSAMP